MVDEKMMLEETNKIQFREINLEEFEASIPAVHAEMNRLEEAVAQSRSIRLRYRVW